MQLIQFTPIYMERVWGGRGLESNLARKLPPDKVIGESWELVDRDEEQSIVAGGPLNGVSVRQLLKDHGREILGPNADLSKPFPILVKWLDCQNRLSLQVHPPAEVADSLGGEPKTENWYIADCEPGASLIVGLKNGVTREHFAAALEEGTVEACAHRFPVKPGDSILVESGRMHAIDAGNLILEIQQNSDTTYRVYDWGRVGLDGKPRQLHIEESLQSIDFNDFEPTAIDIVEGTQTLADCREFRIRKFELGADQPPLQLPVGEEARLIHVTSGSITDQISGTTLQRGDNCLQPYVTEAILKADAAATVLITDRF